MGLDLWFREDIVRILASTQETMRNSIAASPPLDSMVADSYRDGFDDALRSVAVAFGICAPSSLTTDGRVTTHVVQVEAGHEPPASGFATRVWSDNGRAQGEP